MAVSEHLRAAYTDLNRWLDHARAEIVSARLISYDLEFCAESDRFSSSIKLETGIDEVRRRATYLQEISGEGSEYYRAAETAQNAGFIIDPHSQRVERAVVRLPGRKWSIRPILMTRFAYAEWKAIQRTLGESRKAFSHEELDALNRWAEECDKLVTVSDRLHCDGCVILTRAADLLPKFQRGEIRTRRTFSFSESWDEVRKSWPPSLGRESIRAARKAVNGLRRWIIRRKRRPDLTAKQQRALELIKSKGPIKGLAIARQIKVEESTLRTHYLPILRKHGVKNGDDGYYIADD
jgi:hypothetical protein